MGDFEFPKIDALATGQRIAFIMQSQGFRVKDIQTHLRLGSPQAVYQWLKGRSLPSVDNLFALSKLLGVSIDDILVEEGSSNSEHLCLHSNCRGVVDTITYYYLSVRAA